MRNFKLHIIVFQLANTILRKVSTIYPKYMMAYTAAGGISTKHLETPLRILAQLLSRSMKMT